MPWWHNLVLRSPGILRLQVIERLFPHGYPGQLFADVKNWGNSNPGHGVLFFNDLLKHR